MARGLQGYCPGCGKGLLRAPHRDALRRPFCGACYHCDNAAFVAGEDAAHVAGLVHLAPGTVHAGADSFSAHAHDGRPDCATFSVCGGRLAATDRTTDRIEDATCPACCVADRNAFGCVPNHPTREHVRQRYGV